MNKSMLVKVALLAFAFAGTVAEAQWFNPCNAYYQGTWGFRGGRDMSIVVRPAGGNQVSVTVTQQNGSETLWGTCRRRASGGGNLSFSGGINNGNLNIRNDGYAFGSVAGYSFQGYAN